MKFKKLSAVAAAMALASTMAISASATNWAAASYADDNPDTCNILSTDENSITFEQVNDGTAAKIRITLSNILENPEDCANIKTGSWKVTYNNVPADWDNESGLGGGTYAATGNSATYWISPSYDEEGNMFYETSYEVDDSFKYLLPSSVPSDPESAEYVFMDWSNSNMKSAGITITVSDFKLFDADGNEIAQKAYGASADAAAEEAPAEEPAAEEASAEEAPAEEAPAEEAPAEEAPAEAAAPASDDTTTAAATGNTSAAAIAAVMGVAAAAAALSKKRK